MSNYIFADLKRIIKRIPFLISMLLINLALAGVLLLCALRRTFLMGESP